MYCIGYDQDGNFVVQSGARYAIYARGADWQPTTLMKDCGTDCPDPIFRIPLMFDIPETTTINRYSYGVQWFPIDPPQTLSPGRYRPILQDGKVVRFERVMESAALKA
jgi:hypothetical protein